MINCYRKKKKRKRERERANALGALGGGAAGAHDDDMEQAAVAVLDGMVVPPMCLTSTEFLCTLLTMLSLQVMEWLAPESLIVGGRETERCFWEVLKFLIGAAKA